MNLLPLSPPAWTGLGWGPLGRGLLTSECRRGESDPLVPTQLCQQVSDTIGDVELGTCLGWATVVVAALQVQEELTGEDWLHLPGRGGQ